MAADVAHPQREAHDRRDRRRACPRRRARQRCRWNSSRGDLEAASAGHGDVAQQRCGHNAQARLLQGNARLVGEVPQLALTRGFSFCGERERSQVRGQMSAICRTIPLVDEEPVIRSAFPDNGPPERCTLAWCHQFTVRQMTVAQTMPAVPFVDSAEQFQPPAEFASDALTEPEA